MNVDSSKLHQLNKWNTMSQQQQYNFRLSSFPYNKILRSIYQIFVACLCLHNCRGFPPFTFYSLSLSLLEHFTFDRSFLWLLFSVHYSRVEEEEEGKKMAGSLTRHSLATYTVPTIFTVRHMHPLNKRLAPPCHPSITNTQYNTIQYSHSILSKSIHFTSLQHSFFFQTKQWNDKHIDNFFRCGKDFKDWYQSFSLWVGEKRWCRCSPRRTDAVK